MKVLIVDDSVVFRSQIKAALSKIPEVEVVGSAANGKIALSKLENTPADLITLDLEMPEMNGIETLLELRRRGYKTRVIMFSSMTPKGGASALEALKSGADDVVGKPAAEGLNLETATDAIADQLIPRVRQFMAPSAEPVVAPITPSQPKVAFPKKNLDTFRPKIVVIGCSTGGPKALEEIFTGVRGPLRIPILIVQHMPPVFTKSLAVRLSELTGIHADEAKPREPLKSNQIYVAPGDYHMSLVQTADGVDVQLDQGPPQCMVRPAVDPLFESAARIFKQDCMGFILTGMGEDGLRGSRAVKESGGGIMIQNKESCIVFGMPGAVYRAELQDRIGTLSDIQRMICHMTET